MILLTESDTQIAGRTLKRLRALETFDRLGAGFAISAQDLDMRGGGDLLGENQAGHMKLIGTELYQHLLGLALRQARGEAVEQWTPELRIGPPGALPEQWIPEADVRLSLYVRLSRLHGDTELDAFEEEPLALDSPLRQLGDKVLLSPHMISANVGSGLGPGIQWATESVLHALRGEVPDNVYNQEVIPRWQSRFADKSVWDAAT